MDSNILAMERYLDVAGRLMLPPHYRKALGFDKETVKQRKAFVRIELNTETKEIRLTKVCPK